MTFVVAPKVPARRKGTTKATRVPASARDSIRRTKLALGFVLLSALLPSSAAASSSFPAQVVRANANIFAAGLDTSPTLPGGGGSLPPHWQLPAGKTRVVTFPRIVGAVTFLSDRVPRGAAGNGAGPTNITSWRGISGIVDETNSMFLVGVFLGRGRPAGPAPPRLNFTNNEDFKALGPRIGQTFFVGAGKARYRVPAEATRLFLGFAKAHNPQTLSVFQGAPSYYNTNQGSLQVTVRVTTR
jgi:hypothetical protein